MRADRRQFLRDGLWAMSTLVGSPGLLAAAREERARSLPAGVHLFLDSGLIAGERNMRRVIHPPTRLPEPIVTAAEDRCFQPYVSVLRDPRTKRFRMWYNTAVDATRSRIGYLESEDGVRFIRPHRELEDPSGLPVGFGAYVVDDGPDAADPGRRYKLAWENGGLFTATSPDGLKWTASSRRAGARGHRRHHRPQPRSDPRALPADLQGALDARGRLQGEHAEREGGVSQTCRLT